MAEIKKLRTRIALKYDSYANWTDETKEGQGANLVLLKGELGICAIENKSDGAQTAPTVLFKVGDGETPFKTLKWASALAADVYSWAKASDVEVDGKTIKFVGAKNTDGSDKVITLNFATPKEVEDAVKVVADDLADLDSRVAAVEAKFTGDTSVEGQIDSIKGRLNVIEGEGEGSVKKALADAKDYTDEREAAIKTAYEKYADDAKAAAIAAAETASETKVDVERKRIDTLESEKTRLEGKIDGNTTAISNEATARSNADAAIEAKIGTVAEGKTVVGLIEAAQQAADDAQADVDALTAEGGAVTVNTAAIATNAAAIAENTQAITDEKTAREAADTALSGRIDKIDAFFEGAAKDSEGLNNALDKLVDIQNFLSGEGSEVDQMLDTINEHGVAIEALEGVVGDADSGLVKDAADAKAAITAVEGRATALEGAVTGYDTTNTVKKAVEAAQAQADKGVEDAATAQAAAEVAAGAAKAAQDDVDALEIVINGEDGKSGLAADVAKNTSDIAGVAARVDTAEDDIDALQAVVLEGDNTNAKLREAIGALEDVVVNGDDANAKLGAEIDALASVVNHETTGLAATKAIADQNKTDIGTLNGKVAAIESDYLKAADLFIIDCGTSTDVTHVMPTTAE